MVLHRVFREQKESLSNLLYFNELINAIKWLHLYVGYYIISIENSFTYGGMMRKQKSLQELTIKDNFMFCAVMGDELHCRDCLELVLEIPIEKVTVCQEKSIIYHPGYRGIRLDVVARDENHTHYDVEMQVAMKPALGKRARYYHSQLDMDMLKTGTDYHELADAYVIFICDYDPFGKGLYRYTWEMICKEDPELALQDGSRTVILSTKGQNDQDEPEELVKFLKFVGAGAEESQWDYADAYVSRLQKTVAGIKADREMEDMYMLLWNEILRDEREEGRLEGRLEGKIEELVELILDVLSDLSGEIPEDVKHCLYDMKDEDILMHCFRKARKVSSMEEFAEWLNTI